MTRVFWRIEGRQSMSNDDRKGMTERYGFERAISDEIATITVKGD